MPIPPLKKRPKTQPWRQQKKKYYVNRKPKTGVLSLKKKKTKGRYKFDGPKLNLKGIKKKLVYLFGFLAIVGILSILILYAWLARSVADISKLTERQLVESTKIYDRTGEELLYEIHGDIKRTEVKLAEIPDTIKWATIAMEDKNFYKHGGISLWGIFRGVVVETLRSGRAQGGSTLTQQFVKNAILSSERKIIRKLKEWLLSYRIEKKYSKDEILEMYLNEIPYGSTAYGVEAASQRYFGKSVRDISLAESAVLAALPQAPSRYSPYGSNKDLLIGRQQYILDLMVKQEYISQEDADIAKAYELEFNPPATNIKAPHFVMYIKELLSEKYGERMIEQEGLKIITTLDLYKQEIAEKIIQEHAEKNQENYEATNAALISLDPKTGQILAMVGSKDYFNDDIDGQVNITTSLRQPGSSLKPLVYAAAFLKGYTPDTILYDVVTNFSNNKSEPYEPHNYDDQEHGAVTIRKALAGSLNIPAVKVLYLADVSKVLDLAQEIGYTTLGDRDRYGLSLVLGGGEVKLIEHTNAYSAFAREGIVQSIASILRIEDKDGNTIEEFEEQEKKQTIDPKIARQINNILSDNTARAYAFGERNWLTLGSRPVAAKTGTTNDYRDAWTIGFTPSIVTGVWVGNNDNTEMKRGAAGGVVAAPIWHDYMQAVLGDTPIEYFKAPETIQTGKAILDGQAGSPNIVKVDTITGLLATEHTPPELVEERSFFSPHSILYYVKKDDPLGEVPKAPEKDPQFELWESRILEWAEKQKSTSTTASSEVPPTEYDDVHTPENIPDLKILFPNNNQAVLEPILVARISAEAKRGINRVEYYINDNLLSINADYPYNLNKDISFLNNGFHNLRIRACDDVNNCFNKSIEFNLILKNNPTYKDITARLVSPSSGLAITNIDFPLDINLEINQPIPVAKINIYIRKENEDAYLISTLEPIDTAAVSASWEAIPKNGTYTLFAEAITWDKTTIKTNETIVIINNTEPEAIQEQ